MPIMLAEGQRASQATVASDRLASVGYRSSKNTRVLPTIEGGVLCGNKAYCDGPLKKQLAEDQNLDLPTPVKKSKGQRTLSAADKHRQLSCGRKSG